MNSRRNGFGLGTALCLASVYLTFNVPALAQDAAPPGEEKPDATQAKSDDTADKATDEPIAEAVTLEPAMEAEEEPAAKPEQEPAAKPKEEPKAKPEKKEPAAKPQEKASPPEPQPPSEPAAPSDTGMKILAVEQLPGSAYPSIEIRGLTNGSLWRTFHGQQWPYMPSAGSEPNFRIGLSGYLWNDLSNTHISADKSLAGAGVNDQNRWTTQTRGVLRVTPTVNAHGDWFAQGNAEIVVQGDMRPPAAMGALATTDDLWVRAGMWNLFDVTVGRFQGWEIANHYGMALDINTLERQGAWFVTANIPKPRDGYGLTHFWDRQDFLLGGYALHVYPTKYLRAELLSHVGAGSGNAANPYQVDFRPSAIFDVGFLKVKGGWEYGKAIPQDAKVKTRDSKNGYGFAAQFILDPYVELGGSFARGFQDVVDKDGQADLAASNTAQTVGGFLNASPGYEPLVVGFGAYLNHWEDLRVDASVGPHQGKVDTNDQWLIFGAVQYTFWKQLNLKFVFSHASNKVEDYNAGIYINNALSGRLRAEILF